MIARHADKARLLVMSTAWLSSGFFHDIWTNGSEQDWQKTMVLPEDTGRIPPAFLEAERRALGERAYDREYRCQFDSSDANASGSTPANIAERSTSTRGAKQTFEPIEPGVRS